MASDRFNLDDYVSVAERLLKFRADHDGWSLVSEMLVDDGKRIVMRASVIDANGTLRAVGHAEEVRDQGPVNRTSAVENAETSAWGRALACLGLHVSRQIASRDEIQQARQRAERQRDEADPARARRATLLARVKALPEHSRAAFKAWLADNAYPDLPSKLNDDQCAAAEEWVAFAEAAVEHDADSPREAHESHDTPTEGVSAPDGAMDGRTAAAAHYVKGLDSAQLLAEFARRNLRAPRPVGEQRVALTAALVADESWSPDE